MQLADSVIKGVLDHWEEDIFRPEVEEEKVPERAELAKWVTELGSLYRCHDKDTKEDVCGGS